MKTRLLVLCLFIGISRVASYRRHVRRGHSTESNYQNDSEDEVDDSKPLSNHGSSSLRLSDNAQSNLARNRPHSQTNKLTQCRFKSKSKTIIKTKQSISNGAEFLKKPNVYDSDECKTECCKITNCTTAVFEIQGAKTCYLFNCGANENHSPCSFTPHDKYDVVFVFKPVAANDRWSSRSSSSNTASELKHVENSPTAISKHKSSSQTTGKTSDDDGTADTSGYDDYSEDDQEKQTNNPHRHGNRNHVDADDYSSREVDGNTEEKTGSDQSTYQDFATADSSERHQLHHMASSTTPSAPPKKKIIHRDRVHHRTTTEAAAAAASVDEGKTTCGEYQWACAKPGSSGPTCIAQYDVCDGIEQCPDGSDELHCQRSEDDGGIVRRPGDLGHISQDITSKPNGGAAIKSNKSSSSSPHKSTGGSVGGDEQMELMEEGRTVKHYAGAVVALSLGLILTVVALMFVVCRLRNVRRRLLRKGGRVVNAGDDDYLINGMYL